ncbi:hypothetical protein Tco_0487372 [Tanacetum coccineum]
MWNDELRLRLSSSPIPSTPPSFSAGPFGYALSLENVDCSICKFLAAKIKILEATLDMERHPKNHTLIMERGFLSSGGRAIKQKKNSNTDSCVLNDADNVGKHVAGSSSMSKDDIVSRNKEDMSSTVAKIHDIERQMLEGKLVLVGDDEIPLKPLNVDGQATIMDHFPCLSNTFSTSNTTT